jgi:uncharacterized protein YndB with AHSA1/START domain
MKSLLAVLFAGIAATAGAEERRIFKEALVHAPIEAVFEAWSTSAGVKSFLAPDAEIDARPGGRYGVFFDPLGEPGMKGADDERVLAVQPPTMISFTWNAPPSLPQARLQHTAVIVRLSSEPNDLTRVTLTHVGWGTGGEWDKAYDYFDKAWGAALGHLRQRFDEGKPIDWSEWLARLKAMHAKDAGEAKK